MILWSGAVDSIDTAMIELGAGECWIWSSEEVYGLDYQQALQQPISLETIGGLSGMRFLSGIPTTLITVRRGPTTTTRFAWAGTVILLPDPEPDPSVGPAGTVTSVGLEMPDNFQVRDSPVDSSGVMRVQWQGDPDDLVRNDGSTTSLSRIQEEATREIESFPRGDIVWQTDPGGLWDTGLCFVHTFPVLGRSYLTHVDFQFGAVGSGTDGKWALWGGVDATGAWTLLTQGNLPNASKGLIRQELAEISLAGYNLVALAQDPGTSGVTQPVRQASTYYSPNPPSGIPAAYAYLGTHTHNATFTTLPTIPASDTIYLMQKWSSIGVR
jgi:hypothetical protein